MKKDFLVKTLLLLSPLNAYAELSFDISALENTGSGLTDLSRQQLAQVDSQLPGTYVMDVILNGSALHSEPIKLVNCDERLCPELSVTQLKNWGADEAALALADNSNEQGVLRKPLSVILPGSEAYAKPGTSAFIVNIPQKYLQGMDNRTRLSGVSQDGMPALFMSYYYNGQRNTTQQGDDSEQHFLNLNNGLNLGPWRLRQNAYLQHSNDGGSHWRSDQTYLGRDVTSLMSRLMMGQVSTAGRVFDGFNFRGVMLTSIDEMLPDSQRNYAPMISGIALTQAMVEVRQAGNLIYQKSVPPGPFTFADVVPNNSSGDLVVTVRESSGEVRTYIQPYASQPKMVRKGQFRYSLSAGQYENSDANSDDALFAQLEALYGLGNIVTLFGGVMGSQNYQAAASGFGINLGDLGGISLELDASRQQASHHLQQPQGGYASKVSYEKYFTATQTTLNTSLTENQDRRYATYSDYQSRYALDPVSSGHLDNLRRRWQLSVSQSLGSFGSLSLNYYAQKSWDERYQTKTMNASYNTYWKGISTNISYSRSDIRTGTRYLDSVLAMNISIPFSTLWDAPGRMQINHNYSQGRSGYTQNQTSVNGTLLQDNNLSYSLSQTWSKQQNGQGARVQYDGGYGSVNASWSQTGNSNRQYSVGASGAVVVHPGGVTFGQNISANDAFAVISAPGASDVSVTSRSGVTTDWRGYAIVPSLSVYRQNSIGLDAKTAGDDTTLKTTQMQVVPGFGTAINARFDTAIGRKAYLNIRYRNTPLPLGTELHGDKAGSGIVDDKGAAWLTGLNDNETLTARFDGTTCVVSINLDRLTRKKDFYTGNEQCR